MGNWRKIERFYGRNCAGQDRLMASGHSIDRIFSVPGAEQLARRLGRLHDMSHLGIDADHEWRALR